MPQMAPLNWIFLYYIFIILFIMVMVMNYYNYIKKSELETTLMYQRDEGEDVGSDLMKIWKW